MTQPEIWFEHPSDPSRDVLRQPMDLREKIAYLVYRAVDVADRSRAAALLVADDILRLVDEEPDHSAVGGTQKITEEAK